MTDIKAANWAMKDHPDCVVAHQAMLSAKLDLQLATRHEIPSARERFAIAKKRWLDVALRVFRETMAT